MKIKKLLTTITATLLGAALLAGCGAKETNNNASGEAETSNAIYRTVDEIKESGTVKIGVFSDKNPFGYVDAEGKAVSPLYTWQDGKGNIPLENGKNSVELLKEKIENAGMLAAGYGLVTHYYLQK